VLLATRRGLHMYSIATSLLVRTIEPEIASPVIDFKLSVLDPRVAYIVHSNGHLSLWNWQEGIQLSSMHFGGSLGPIALNADADTRREQLYLMLVKGPQSHQLVSMQVSHVKSQKTPDFAVIRTFEVEVEGLRVFENGQVIFAVFKDSVSVGIARTENKQSESKHSWTSLSFLEGISAFDIRQEHVAAPKDSGTGAVYRFAIGSKLGPVYLYEDLMHTITGGKDLKPRRMHWHRRAVGSIKWSLDGKLFPTNFL
jgi:NET1-associated nuclear protein 1 (U3 small nucleolar RNA-associated protein 17)